MNQVESPPEQRIPLNSANQGNGHLKVASDNERPRRNKWNVRGFMLKFKKTAIIIAVIILCLLASVIGNFFQYKENRRSQAEVQQLRGEVQRLQATYPKSCTQSWILHNQSCYFFSETEVTWILAYNNCTSSGGKLLVMDNYEERAFVLKTKGQEEYWIENPLVQPNGSVLNRPENKSDGYCPYLYYDMVKFTDCNDHLHFICRKPLQTT